MKENVLIWESKCADAIGPVLESHNCSSTRLDANEMQENKSPPVFIALVLGCNFSEFTRLLTTSKSQQAAITQTTWVCIYGFLNNKCTVQKNFTTLFWSQLADAMSGVIFSKCSSMQIDDEAGTPSVKPQLVVFLKKISMRIGKVYCRT